MRRELRSRLIRILRNYQSQPRLRILKRSNSFNSNLQSRVRQIVRQRTIILSIQKNTISYLLANRQLTPRIGYRPSYLRALTNSRYYSRGDCFRLQSARQRRRQQPRRVKPSRQSIQISILRGLLVKTFIALYYLISRSNAIAIAISTRKVRAASVAIYRS